MGVFHRFADQHKRIWVTVMGLTALVASIVGIFGVFQSDLFTVRVVEVGHANGSLLESEIEFSPLDAQEILEIAQVPTDSTNLFSLKVGGIQRRLMNHPWIRTATVSKRFPQTVAITVEFREPIALSQSKTGKFFYLDWDGSAFAPLNLRANSDLPVLVEIPQDQVSSALSFLKEWNGQGMGSQFRLSSLEWSDERGLEVMATYALPGQPGRVRIALGRSFLADPHAQLGRVREVLTYLSQNKVRARQVFADLGKKIVVRIARSS